MAYEISLQEPKWLLPGPVSDWARHSKLKEFEQSVEGAGDDPSDANAILAK